MSGEWTFNALHNTNIYWCSMFCEYQTGPPETRGRLPRLLVKSAPALVSSRESLTWRRLSQGFVKDAPLDQRIPLKTISTCSPLHHCWEYDREKHSTVSLLHSWCRREWITEPISRETEWNSTLFLTSCCYLHYFLRLHEPNRISGCETHLFMFKRMGFICLNIFSLYSSLCVCISWGFLVNRKSVLFRFSQEDHINFQHHPLTNTQYWPPSSKVLHLLI